MGGIGSGSKPKEYPPELVGLVRSLYTSGSSQIEVAAACGISQRVVWRIMVRYEIPRRRAIKRDQRGPRNSSWKGDDAGYSALHLRVATERGTPSLCEHCGTTNSKRFEWANLTGNYTDVFDYGRLCSSCHHKMDGTIKNIRAAHARKEVQNA